MKYLLIPFSLLLFSFANLEGWNTNMEDAKKTATAENKYILLNFSGSDWCGNYIKLERELFSKDTFINYSTSNFVLLNADFPTKKKNKLSPKQVSQNEKLAEKFNPNGIFPLTVVLNSNGEKIREMKYPCKNTIEYIQSLNKIIHPE